MNQEIFKCLCKERKGDVVRTVTEVDFTVNFFNEAWAKQFPKYKTLMGREIKSFPEFVSFFVRERLDGSFEPKGICYKIDDVGIFWLSDLNWPAYAEVHYTFWDGGLNGRLELCKKGIAYAFHQFNFQCLYVKVAGYADKHIKFVETMGFRKEGTLRSRVKYKEAWWDLKCYSLLKHEIADWRFEDV